MPALFVLVNPSVIAHQTRVQHCQQIRTGMVVESVALHFKMTFRVVPHTGYNYGTGCQPDLLNCHCILGQCAGFIGTDDRSRTQRFGSLQTTQQSLAADHGSNAQRKADGDHRR